MQSEEKAPRNLSALLGETRRLVRDGGKSFGSLFAFCSELSMRQYLNLVLAAFRRVFAPSVDCLASLKLERFFQSNLRPEKFNGF